MFWKQKSSEKWILNEDRNTKYFHARVKAKRRKHISKMLLGNDPNDWPEDI